jgi:hypothetical protein
MWMVSMGSTSDKGLLPRLTPVPVSVAGMRIAALVAASELVEASFTGLLRQRRTGRRPRSQASMSSSAAEDL